MLVAQELLKVLFITLLSPQMLPSIRAVRQTGCRTMLRLGARAVVSVLYHIILYL